MKQVKCAHCEDVVTTPSKGEQIKQGETPVEHMERTGHAHIREPRPTGCPSCGNLWMYGGSAERATCPNCRSKTTPGVVPPID